MAEGSYPDALPAQYRLHWYTLERVLGQGGFGITYLARDTNLDQAVAIKEYLPVDVATRRADATVRARTDEQNERYRWGLERFIREARTLARFDHPNIVRVHSVFELNDTAYMVMRFEEGENLAALLERRRTLPEPELLRVLLPILDGLELVHDAGFIHRDIKPDNIHIRADGSPVLLDFGSARLALGHARTVTILVAPGYAPFEQYYSAGENQGPWTDIYGLGATSYRAISGIAPLDAIARSKGILGSTREILVPASALGAGRYSAQVLKAIDHALEFSEKDRPQTLAQWRTELTEPAVGQPAAVPPAAAHATKTGSRPVEATAVHATLPARAATGNADRWSGARAPVIGAVVGALVAAIAVVVWQQPATDPTRLAEALERSEAERRRLEERQREQERRDAQVTLQAERERQRLEEQSRRDAEARQRAEEERQKLEEQLRREAEAQRLAAEKRRLAEDAARAAARKAAPVAPREASETAKAKRPAMETALPVETARLPAGSDTARGDGSAPPPLKPTATGTRAAEPEPPRDAPAVAAARPPEPARPKSEPDERTRALRGDPAAQFTLGERYEFGRGVPQNNFQAYYWYSAAVRGGNAAARAKKEQMAARLQPAEIQQAEKLVERLARPLKSPD